MSKPKLARDLIGVLAIKLLALMAIYYLFFAAPPRIDAERHFVSALAADQQR